MVSKRNLKPPSDILSRRQEDSLLRPLIYILISICAVTGAKYFSVMKLYCFVVYIELNVSSPLRSQRAIPHIYWQPDIVRVSRKIAENPISIIEDPKERKKSVCFGLDTAKSFGGILKDMLAVLSQMLTHNFFSRPLNASAWRVTRNVCVPFLQFNGKKPPTRRKCAKTTRLVRKKWNVPRKRKWDRKRQSAAFYEKCALRSI